VPDLSPSPGPSGRAFSLDLSHEEILRYSRHLLLPEVGMAGQHRLKGARVLLVGAGGLGSPVALYLAAAGIGTLGVVEFDRLDLTNLQRQVVHGTTGVGRPKLDSLRARLQDLNPHVAVEGFAERLTSANALEILRGFDVVIDGSDNFPTRYLVNDAAVLLAKPLVYGAIFRFDGQVSVFDARRGPCYRCLYSEPPPPGLVPNCAEGGVLGVLPGIIGSLQALEALKLVLGAGDPLVGRLLLFDALRLKFRELALRKDPDCPLCGTRPTVRELADYEAFCGITPVASSPELEITPAMLRAARQDGARRLVVLDVREPHEWEIARLEAAQLLPLGQLPSRLGEIDPHAEIVTYCHFGTRSLRAAEVLRAAGFSNVRSLAGGIDAWAEQIDQGMARY
jgi:molybdopterin/thiamine biosynthesis adenylyltransferase/rhodanese-related sulfurtransferase